MAAKVIVIITTVIITSISNSLIAKLIKNYSNLFTLSNFSFKFKIIN